MQREPVVNNRGTRAYLFSCSFDDVVTAMAGDMKMLEPVGVIKRGECWKFATAKEADNPLLGATKVVGKKRLRCWGVKEGRQ